MEKEVLMKKLAILSSVILTAQLTGCATVVSGERQNISVVTSPVEGAQCSLENNKGKWTIPKTPGKALVQRSGKNLTIICEKKGYKKAISEIKPGTNKVTYANLLFGGIIGLAIDNSSGASYEYPMSVKVPLAPQK